ncbi:MAG TPA: DUF4333 domain-containing protein [Candidatus Nanopelagicales bacterium]|nr:DUF4333 domain-containing protein [Candidatus Nanopelagicales bacterium]
MTDPDLPQAGWYPDPSGAPALRWWNGVTWSDQTHPLSPDAARPSPAAAPPTAPLPTTQVWAPVVPPAEESVGSATAARRRWWIPVVALVALLALAGVAASALLGGIGGRDRLDTRALEQRIAAELSRQAGTQVTVSCPSRVDLRAGSSFTCTASDGQGGQAAVVVQQTDDSGDVTWTLQR